MLIGILIFGAFNVYIIVILVLNNNNKTFRIDYYFFINYAIILFLDFFVVRVSYCALFFGFKILSFQQKSSNISHYIEHYIELE